MKAKGYHFDEEKSVQLAALFLKLRGGEMKHLKLIKLMYLADREALGRWEHPITGDSYVSMKFGLVLSNVLGLIHDETRPAEHHPWHEFIQPSECYAVKLVQECGTSRLSEAEEDLAREIFERYGKVNRWELVDITDKFPEFKEPDDEHLSWDVPCESVLVALGKTPQQATAICRDLELSAQSKDLLGV
jgi:hypothetical protein